MKKKKVLHLLNSGFGLQGNIGFRTLMLLKNSNESVEHFVIARSGISYDNVILLWPLGYFSRLMNLIRKKVLKSFNHRIIEIYIWEMIGLLYLRFAWSKIDIVHSWDYLPKVASKCRKLGICYLQEVPILPMSYNRKHQLKTRLFYSRSLEKQESLAIKLSNFAVCPSKYVSEYISNVTNNPVTIPFGAKTLESSKQSQDNEASNHTYIFVGNVNLRKGFDILIEAWLDPVFDGDRLLVLGRRDKSIPNKWLSVRGLEYLGYQNPNPFYSESDTFILPSFSEGSAKVVYEAASHRLFCIVSAQAGSVVENMKDGIVLREITKQNLLEAMLLAKSNLDLRKKFQTAIYDKIHRFTWKTYSDKVHKLYERV